MAHTQQMPTPLERHAETRQAKTWQAVHDDQDEGPFADAHDAIDDSPEAAVSALSLVRFTGGGNNDDVQSPSLDSHPQQLRLRISPFSVYAGLLAFSAVYGYGGTLWAGAETVASAAYDLVDSGIHAAAGSSSINGETRLVLRAGTATLRAQAKITSRATRDIVLGTLAVTSAGTVILLSELVPRIASTAVSATTTVTNASWPLVRWTGEALWKTTFYAVEKLVLDPAANLAYHWNSEPASFEGYDLLGEQEAAATAPETAGPV